MTLVTESPFEALLAAPLDAQTANPLEETVRAVGSRHRRDGGQRGSSDEQANIEDVRRQARAPREREAQQYVDDERRSRVLQARALTEAAPGSATAWTRLAQALVAAGDVHEAVASARRAVSAPPIDADRSTQASATSLSQFLAARLLAQWGALDEAEEVLCRLQGSGPWRVLFAAIAEERGDHDLALARLADDTSSEALAFQGYLRIKLNKPQQALRDLRAAQTAGATSPSLLLNQAYAFALLGAPRKAIRAARQAVVLAPCSRHASFNLASYLRASGEYAEAIKELLRLRTHVGEGDPHLAAALADAFSASGRHLDALRELRRAQHHHNLPPDSPRIAELKANTALLEWKGGQKTRGTLLKVIRQQLAQVGPNLPLLLMLADVSGGRQAQVELRRHYEALRAQKPELDTRPLLMRLQLAEGNLEGAADTAVAHAVDNPLDVEAVRGALILQAQIKGDYEVAASAGLAALSRIPGDPMLRNNVAFCLTLAGRASEAMAVLQRQPLDDPYLLATRGLVEFGLGHVSEGLHWYNKAADHAVGAQRDTDETGGFLLLLRIQEALALLQVAPEHPEAKVLIAAVPAPEAWPDETSYLILRRVAARLGLRPES